MAEEEVNIISHLLEVEQNAYLQAKIAQESASKMLSEAKAAADAEYKTQYDKLILEFEENYKQRKEQISTEYKNTIDNYKSSVQQTEQDKKSFNSFIQKAIEEE